jgi:cbb3-type cytochrome oxidase subunit 3
MATAYLLICFHYKYYSKYIFCAVIYILFNKDLKKELQFEALLQHKISGLYS